MRQIMNWLGAAGLALGLAAIALAQTSGSSGQTQSSDQAQTQTQVQSQAQTEAQAKVDQAQTTVGGQAQAKTEMSAESRARLDGIKEKGAKVSVQERAKTDAKLQTTAAKVNMAASSTGDATMAERLSKECDVTSQQLLDEKSATGASWGAVLLAHTLSANAAMDVAADQLLQLNNEGTGWGQIAAGLGLKLGTCVSAFETESRVAAGTAKPDGKMAVIRGEGARVGLDGRAIAGVNTAGLDLGARAGVGVGVRIKP